MSGLKNVRAESSAGPDDEKRLLPMLVAGLILIVGGMIAVMWFV